MSLITVAYRCCCHEVDRIVELEERRRDEDLAEWMLTLQKVLSKDHAASSPACERRVLARVEIATTPGLPIGRVST